MERRIGRRIGALLLCMLLLVPVMAQGQTRKPLEAVAQHIGCAYEDLLTSEKLVPGESVSDWLAIATSCSGDPVKRNAYLKGLEDYVTEQYAKNGGLHRIKATEWHRISLAILALGGDPTAFGKDAVNLIADGTYNFKMADSLGLQGLNGWIFALITLDAADYEVPDNARFTREDMIHEIIAAQTESGGFGLSGNSADVDITAMALQALAPYHAENANVGDQRSSICYDEDTDAYYFTTKGGDFYQIKVEEDGSFKENSLRRLHLDNGADSEDTPPMSTSTPVIYNGRAYIGVSGVGQFNAYSGHNMTVIDLETFSIAYTVPTQGYPQTSGLLTTAYEDTDGYVYRHYHLRWLHRGHYGTPVPGGKQKPLPVAAIFRSRLCDQ